MSAHVIQFSPFLNPMPSPTYIQAGQGFLGDANQFIKKNNLVTKGLKAAAMVTGNDDLRKAAKVTRMVGYGFLSKANQFAKKSGVVGKSLALAGEVTGNKKLVTASKVAKTVGYGKKKARKSKK